MDVPSLQCIGLEWWKVRGRLRARRCMGINTVHIYITQAWLKWNTLMVIAHYTMQPTGWPTFLFGSRWIFIHQILTTGECLPYRIYTQNKKGHAGQCEESGGNGRRTPVFAEESYRPRIREVSAVLALGQSGKISLQRNGANFSIPDKIFRQQQQLY